MTDSRYFCIRPFTHLQIEPNGEVKICCIATDVVRDGGRRMNLHVDSLDDVWRSDALTEIRRTLIADQPVRECARCNHYQAGSSGELRTVVNADWDRRFRLARTVTELNAAPGQPLGPRPNEYQLNLGPLCNLKCRMCGTRYSSRIAEDPVFSRWADDYHPDSAVVGRWRGDKLVLLPRYLLGAKYTGFGNGLWSRDRSLHRDMLGPATIALPHTADAVPTALELGISSLNQGSFIGTVSINGTPVRRSEWFPGQQLRIDLPADATAGSGDIEIQLQALGFTPGPTGAGPLIESLVLHRARVADAPRTRNERAFLRHAEGMAWYDDPAILEELVADPKAVTHLILQGGEPMLIPATEWLIDRLIAAGAPQETSLQFVTNATIYKPALIEKLRRFRRVEMICSVDGVGPVLEYIRYPARWAQVAETVERFCALGFVDVSIAVAAQIYNLFDLPNLLRYADGRGLPVGLHFLSDPVRLNILALPPPAREPAIAALERYLAAHPTGTNRAVATFVIEHLASQRAKIIPGQLDDLFAFTNDLDDVNGQSIRAACPELVAALAAIGQPWGEQRLFSPAAPA